MCGDGLGDIRRQVLLHDPDHFCCRFPLGQMPFLSTFRNRPDDLLSRQVHDFEIAAPANIDELWISNVDRPHTHHPADQ